jgi:hypothetical protein
MLSFRDFRAPLVGGFSMDKDCPHLIPDENWNCEDCGAPIPMPELPPNYEPNLGNVMEICKLIDETRAVFDSLIKANTDPKNPNLPRLRMVGGQMIRLPHKMVCKGMIGPSFVKAKAAGYRGTQDRWMEMILEDDIATLTSPPVV